MSVSMDDTITRLAALDSDICILMLDPSCTQTVMAILQTLQHILLRRPRAQAFHLRAAARGIPLKLIAGLLLLQ